MRREIFTLEWPGVEEEFLSEFVTQISKRFQMHSELN